MTNLLERVIAQRENENPVFREIAAIIHAVLDDNMELMTGEVPDFKVTEARCRAAIDRLRRIAPDVWTRYSEVDQAKVIRDLERVSLDRLRQVISTTSSQP